MAFDGDDFGKSLKYPFQDPQWFSKLIVQGLVLTLLSGILIGIPFFVGFATRCAQKGIKDENALPGWDEWGSYWSLGWRTIAVSIVYFLPIALVPLLALSLAFGAFASGSVEYGIVGIVLFGLAYAFVVVYSLVVGFFMTAAHLTVALERPFGDAFAIKSLLWPFVKKNIGSIIFVGTTVYLGAYIALLLGVLALFVGLFLVGGYIMAMSGYTVGLMHHKSSVKLTEQAAS